MQLNDGQAKVAKMVSNWAKWWRQGQADARGQVNELVQGLGQLAPQTLAWLLTILLYANTCFRGARGALACATSAG